MRRRIKQVSTFLLTNRNIRISGSSSFTQYKQLSTNNNFRNIDEKWRNKWEKEDLVYSSKSKDTNANKENFYSLVMFPYPSGVLHLGHLRVYTISDVVARYKKMRGFNVIHPMGWDAFGLPAENAAVERNIDPAIWTETNIAKMKEQMKSFLADFDWDREINTSSPDYYKWTQKIFLMLFEKGLAYRKDAEINWDPIDKTVLANEQVDSKGRSWRSGAIVEKKKLEQWFIGITTYADRLVEDLKQLDQWPENVKTMQKNWIGKSQGCIINFPTNLKDNQLHVYTSRPETLFGVQFIALSMNHPIVVELSKVDHQLKQFLHDSKDHDFDSRDGYRLKNISASIPLNPSNEIKKVFDVPIYVAPYVSSDYGTGAVMGCPGHDTRDFEFWRLHQPNEPIIQVVGPKGKQVEMPYTSKNGTIQDKSTLENGLPNLESYRGLSCKKAAQMIIKNLTNKNFGEASTQYKLKDWLISRQRYWGAPIPIIYCKHCGPVAVPDEELPVILPKVNSKHFEKGSPLGNIDEFVNCKCPSCGEPSKRETDTMDTFMDSSWYYLRYLDSKNEKELLSPSASEDMPVDLYVGGVEHAILHLLYSRFIAKFLSDCGVWKGKNGKDEPIIKLVTQGMVHGKTYSDPDTKKFLRPEEIDFTNSNEPIIKKTGKDPIISFEKMSKSKYNGADPGECIEKYGADATRAQMLFSAPVNDTLLWNEEQILGVERWLKKVITLGNTITTTTAKPVIHSTNTTHTIPIINNLNKTYKNIKLNEEEFLFYNQIQNLTQNIAKSIDIDFSLNTIVSDLMKMTNLIYNATKSNTYQYPLIRNSYEKLLLCMAPVTPATAEECWESLQLFDGIQETVSIFKYSFPTDKPIDTSFQNFNIFINGKSRGTILAQKDLINQNDFDLIKVLKQNESVSKHLPGSIKKIIKKSGVLSIIS
ncbi:NAM2 [Candida jiufengensis]|uniref:NAM2 n=1 Tax=Candida jiufengensis TaxID=497108 RepID=UPI0022242E4E|nr:NAM2 [Candida jiufengensis]KAI5956991.1 NAM2 [Candida jiufengensis]